MYCEPNFKTKKLLKDAIRNGRRVTVFQPGPFQHIERPKNETVYLEGPHYPQMHTWYAKAKIEDGVVVRVQ